MGRLGGFRFEDRPFAACRGRTQEKKPWMSVLKFKITQPNFATQNPELRRAYVTGLDRTPGRTLVELRPHMLICRKESAESGRIFVPWPTPGFGMPVVGTATLVEREAPYDLAVELARGKLNDVRNQIAEWTLLGLKTVPELDHAVSKAQGYFAKAATAQDAPADAFEAAQACLSASFSAARLLADLYTKQVLEKRMAHGAKVPALLATVVADNPRDQPYSHSITHVCNAAVVGYPWGKIAPVEGKYRWEDLDLQLAWCRRRRITPIGAPVLEFRPASLPDWLWLWEGDYDSVASMVADLVKQTVTRYRGKFPIWKLVSRPASTDTLGLSEEQQIQITVRALQVAREISPSTQFVVEFDRPWGEWMGARPYQLGPLHLANSLAQAEVGLFGIGLEVTVGYGPPGSHHQDILEYSKLLDLYSLIGLPLHVTLVFPSSSEPDPNADPTIEIEPRQLPAEPSEALQREFAEHWAPLTVAKPFVRSLTIGHASDSQPHVYPNASLYRSDFAPKPALKWLKAFRDKFID